MTLSQKIELLEKNHLSEQDDIRKMEIELKLTELYSYVSYKKVNYYHEFIFAREIDKNSSTWLDVERMRLHAIGQHQVTDQILEELEILIKKAKEKNYTEVLFECYQTLGFFYLYKQDMDKCALIFDETEKLLPLITDPEDKVMYYCTRYYFDSQRNINLGAETLFTALDLSKTIAAKYVKAYVQLQLAMWYAQTNQYEKAIPVFEECVTLSMEEGALLIASYATQHLSRAYKMIGDKENQKRIAVSRISLLEKTEDKELIPSAHRILAEMYLADNDLERAKENIDLAKKSCKEQGLTNELGLVGSLEAKYYELSGNFQQALQCLEQSLDIQKENSLPHQLESLQFNLFTLYAKAGNFEKAFEYQTKYWESHSALLAENKLKEVSEMQTKYETEKKEAQLRETKLQQLDAELKAIKSQMNPHFVFNVMSTVDNLIEKGETENARASLHTFAKLMRATLQQSQEEFTLIEDEVLLLENYIQLEKLAIGDSLSFTIKVDKNIDPTYDRVPAMLLQPIVENALKHGLRHKEGNKKLTIGFGLEEDVLKIEIEDNGIGRKASAELNKHRKNHQSFAGSAIENRIKFLNEKEEKNKYGIEVEDLKEGTKVIVRIER